MSFLVKFYFPASNMSILYTSFHTTTDYEMEVKGALFVNLSEKNMQDCGY